MFKDFWETRTGFILQTSGLIIVLMIFTIWYAQNFDYEPLIGVLATLGGLIINFVAFITKDPSKYNKNDFSSLGLKAVFAEARDKVDVLKEVENSQSEINISGYTLRYFADSANIQNALLAKVTQGVNVKILISNPSSKSLSACVDPANLPYMIGSMTESYKKLLQVRQQLPINSQQRFNVSKINENMVLDGAIMRFDEKIYFVHYLHSIQTPDSPVYVIEGSSAPLFKHYLKWFNSLWNNSHTEQNENAG